MDKFATTAFLALDVSTSCTGVAAFDAAGVLLGTLFHKPKAATKKNPELAHFLVKADGLRQLLQPFAECPVQAVWIEEPLSNSPSRQTVNILIRYNAVVSLFCWQLFGSLPNHLSVYDWRRQLCPEFLKVKKGKAGPEQGGSAYTWQMSPGVDPKEYVLAKVVRWHPHFVPALNPDGGQRPETLDMSDAVGVGTAGLLQRGVLSWEELRLRLAPPRLQRGTKE